MEEYLEGKGSFVSGVFCVDISLKQKMNVVVVECCCMCKKSGESS